MITPNSSARSSLENNLLNVRVNDPAYRVYVSRVLKELSKRDAELAGLAKLVPQTPIVVGDSFFLHYSYTPILRTVRNPDDVLEEIREGLLKYVRSKDYRSIRPITMLDDDMSLLFSYRLTKKFLEVLKKKVEEEARNEGMDEDQLRRVMQALAQIGTQIGSERGKGVGEVENTAVTDAKRLVQKALNNMKGKLKDTVRQVASKARKDVEIMEEVMEVFSGKGRGRGGGVGGTGAGDEPSKLTRLIDILDTLKDVRDAEKILALGKKLAESMPRMVKLLKVRGRRGDEIYGYYRTTRLERVIPRELALPDELFYAKLASGGLSAREYVNLYEGAYYVLIDKSGSMRGEKTVWARSVALAIYRLARRKRRKFFLRFFDAGVYDLITDPIESFKAIVSIPSSGGTKIDKALEVAVRDLREGKVRGTSTIIIITDGEDTISTKPEALKSVNASLTAVMIRGHNPSLEELARGTGGEYLTAKLTPEGALSIIEKVS